MHDIKMQIFNKFKIYYLIDKITITNNLAFDKILSYNQNKFIMQIIYFILVLYCINKNTMCNNNN